MRQIKHHLEGVTQREYSHAAMKAGYTSIGQSSHSYHF